MRTGKIESPRRWKSGESILFPGDLPYESDEGSCCTFSGSIKVFKPYMIIQCYAYMYFQNSQGGRSWKAPFSTVARVASRRNHVHCHVHQDTHSYPLHTLQRKEKEMKLGLSYQIQNRKKINKAETKVHFSLSPWLLVFQWKHVQFLALFFKSILTRKTAKTNKQERIHLTMARALDDGHTMLFQQHTFNSPILQRLVQSTPDNSNLQGNRKSSSYRG